MKHILEDTDISHINIQDTKQLSSPLWLLEQPVVILDLNKPTKTKTYLLIYQEKLYNKGIKECLPKEVSIFTNGISAIHLALNIISTSN